MSENYKATLTKEALIYNLIYHLKGCTTEEEINAVVRKIIESFEEIYE